MKLPVYNRIADNKLQHVQDLDFSEVGTTHQIVASDIEEVVDVRHTAFTGKPHPRWLIFPKVSTTELELRDDGNIYITCDKAFQCEVEHSARGPYKVFDRQPNVALWVSGKQSPFAKTMRTETDLDIGS